MKLKNIFSSLAATLMALCLIGCDEEKDPVIIEGDLPIKTSSLFMVGDATPNGWNIDNPTPLEASADEPSEDDLLIARLKKLDTAIL